MSIFLYTLQAAKLTDRKCVTALFTFICHVAFCEIDPSCPYF